MNLNDINFNSHWNKEEQRMYFSCNKEIYSPINVTLKDYQSNAVLWSATYNHLPANVNYWICPVPKQHMDYENDNRITGVRICIYDNINNNLLYENPYFFKFKNIPTITLSNTIPYYFNYLEFFVDKKYDKFFLNNDLSNYKKFTSVVDVGANVGIFTKYILENNISDNITCVECDPKALSNLTKNYKHDNRVEIIKKAFSTSLKPINFYHSEENPVISSTLSPDELNHHDPGSMGNNIIQVETVTISDLIKKLGTIDLLKVDIEGGEYKILNNLTPKQANKINNIFVECHWFENDYESKYKNLLSHLSSLDYEIEEFKKDQMTKGTSEVIFCSKIKK